VRWGTKTAEAARNAALGVKTLVVITLWKCEELCGAVVVLRRERCRSGVYVISQWGLLGRMAGCDAVCSVVKFCVGVGAVCVLVSLGRRRMRGREGQRESCRVRRENWKKHRAECNRQTAGRKKASQQASKQGSTPKKRNRRMKGASELGRVGCSSYPPRELE
jgi:hypothetical protein